MPKHIDNVPKLAEFRPPWITEDGTEVDIDKDKLKKYIHGVILDKAKALDSRDDAAESLKAAEAERDEYKGQVDGKDPDSAKKIEKLEKQVKDAEAAVAKAELANERLTVITEKGLDATQAKYLSGDTKEELEARADEILKDFGAKPEADDEDDEDEDEDDLTGRTSPQSGVKLVNGGDPVQHADTEPDYDKIAAEITRTNFI